MDQANLDNIIVALLFASDEPLSLRKISGVLDDCPVEQIREAIDRIRAKFRGDDSVMQLEQVAGGFQFSTNSAYSEYIALLYRGRRKQRLSKAAMETLAIIVYKQPVTRADIENLRGVGCGGVITTLMERTLIRIVGKAKVLGSPFLYGTTQEFLEYLGLNSLRDLPSMEDLEALLEREAAGENGFELGEPTREGTETAAQPDFPADGTIDEPETDGESTMADMPVTDADPTIDDAENYEGDSASIGAAETDGDLPMNETVEIDSDSPLHETATADENSLTIETPEVHEFSPITGTPVDEVDSPPGAASASSVREEDFMTIGTPAEPAARETSPMDDARIETSASAEDDSINGTAELPARVESTDKATPEKEFKDTRHVDDHEEK